MFFEGKKAAMAVLVLSKLGPKGSVGPKPVSTRVGTAAALPRKTEKSRKVAEPGAEPPSPSMAKNKPSLPTCCTRFVKLLEWLMPNSACSVEVARFVQLIQRSKVSEKFPLKDLLVG